MTSLYAPALRPKNNLANLDSGKWSRASVLWGAPPSPHPGAGLRPRTAQAHRGSPPPSDRSGPQSGGSSASVAALLDPGCIRAEPAQRWRVQSSRLAR